MFLFSTNPTPCFGDTVDIICHYPDVMERVNGQQRYLGTTASYRVNGEDIFPDEDVFNQRSLNQTASRLRVRIDLANFTGDPVSFSCFLLLTGGGEDSATTMVDPQGRNMNTLIDYIIIHLSCNQFVITCMQPYRCCSAKYMRQM